MPIGNRSTPEPSRPVSLQRDLGLWYEIGRYENGFERGLEAVTADYGERPDRTIRIVNKGRVGSPAGRTRMAEGRAKVVGGSANAKLKVSFFGPFFIGDYWVMDHAENYAWSIVGEPSGRYLWLLSRTPAPSAETRAAIELRARELGYDTKLIRVTQQGVAGAR
ncbi:MAG TPA: lipocalin family protein [Caulobacteraceae bacterium]|nr:lipocalin family protein [Caulobacteraceae bacterium]